MKPLQNLIMLSLNKKNTLHREASFVEDIPNNRYEKENLYFGSTVFSVLFVASVLLFFTRSVVSTENRPPPKLQHTITQFQNAIDEISFIAEINNVPLPLSLDELIRFEIEPFVSKVVTSMHSGCFLYKSEQHELKLTYQNDKNWYIYWRLNDHDIHVNEMSNEFCNDTEHWYRVADKPFVN